MEIFIFCFLAAACGAALTSIACRPARVRRRRPGWHLLLFGVVVTTFLTMLYVGREDLVHPERWDDYKGGFWPPVVFASSSAAVIALLSSAAALLYFRTRFRDEKQMP
jgi:hypothetical protein